MVGLEMNRERERDESEPIPDDVGVIACRDLLRVVDYFQPFEAVEGNDGGRAKTGVDHLIAGDGAFYEHVEAALLHRSAKNERIAPVDPNDVDVDQKCLQPIRRSKIAPEVELGDVEAQGSQCPLAPSARRLFVPRGDRGH
jgi:hypothetical protein